MNRESLKTLGAVALIGIIVVATFLYGNQQRQKQLRHDQQVALNSPKPSENRAAIGVASPTPTKTPVKSAATPTPTTSGVSVSANVGGGSLPNSTPSTGGEVNYLLPIALIVGLYQVWVRSRKDLRQAVSAQV